MTRVTESRIEVVNVELKADDVAAVCIAHAREVVKNDPVHRHGLDDGWPAVVVKDGYGGFVVTFRKKIDTAAA